MLYRAVELTAALLHRTEPRLPAVAAGWYLVPPFHGAMGPSRLYDVVEGRARLQRDVRGPFISRTQAEAERIRLALLLQATDS